MRIEVSLTVDGAVTEAAVEDVRDPDSLESQQQFEDRLLQLVDRARKSTIELANPPPPPGTEAAMSLALLADLEDPEATVPFLVCHEDGLHFRDAWQEAVKAVQIRTGNHGYELNDVVDEMQTHGWNMVRHDNYVCATY